MFHQFYFIPLSIKWIWSCSIFVDFFQVWEYILDKVEKSQDIQNFCKAYPNWDRILHRTKQAWLFDQVFPCLFVYLSKDDTLNCRITCKRWLLAVDNFLENNQVRRPLLPAQQQQGPFLRLRTLSTWLLRNHLLQNEITPLKADIFEREAQQCYPRDRNPILGRSAIFKFEPECAHSTNFLTKFGKHIWFLRIESRQNGASWLFWRLVEILPLVPNLKKLEVVIRPVGAPSGLIPSYMEELEEQWKQNHLPPLHHLESLEITEHDLFHGYILKNVLISTYAPKIHRLSINQYSIPGSIQLANLTELTISADTDYQVESLLRLQSPVTRLTLYIAYNDHDVNQDYPNLVLVFRAVQHFRNTLRSLYIQFPGPHSSVNWQNLNLTLSPLQLPHLQTLGFRECTPLSFNLIAGLSSSLEYLHIYSYRVREGVSPLEDSITNGNSNSTATGGLPSNEILDIHRCLQTHRLMRENIYRSNMWNLLPKLKEFTVTMDNNEAFERKYMREAYDKYFRMGRMIVS